MTDPKKIFWRQCISQFINVVVVVVLTFIFARLDKSIDQTNIKQDNLSEQSKRIYELLYIEYQSTDYALAQMFDGKYTELKCDKKEELKDDFEFKYKSKGD